MTEVQAVWPAFKAAEWFNVKGRGWVAVVKLDKDRDDLSLLHSEVLIDGNLYKCLAVERFAHTPPWRAGESVGLLIEGERLPDNGDAGR